MKDEAKIKAGVPYALSRKWEKAFKKNTHKKRRQNDLKVAKKQKEEK